MQIDTRLLAELAQLLRRYPAEEWARLADALEDEELRRTLISGLRNLAVVGSSLPRRAPATQPKSRRRPNFKSALLGLKQRDPVKFELLARARQKLISRELLSSASELRSFAEKLGVSVPSKGRREQAVAMVIRALAEFPSEQIQQKLGLEWPSSQNTSTYEQWVDVIMGKERRTKP